MTALSLPRHLRTAALAAACVFSLALTVAPEAAHADSTVLLDRAVDPTGDTTADTGVGAADKSAYDAVDLSVRQRLQDDGKLLAEFGFTMKDLNGIAEVRNVRATVSGVATSTVEGKTTTRTIELVGNLDRDPTMAIDGQPLVCNGLTFGTFRPANDIRFEVPLACLPAADTISVSGETIISTGDGKVRDEVAATAAVDVNGSYFERQQLTDPLGDVDYATAPEKNRFIAKSADLSAVNLSSMPTAAVISGKVTDLSTRSWDPVQDFTFKVFNADKAALTFTGRADTTKPGGPVEVESGKCKASLAFDTTTNTATLTVPRSCLKTEAGNAFKTVAASVKTTVRLGKGTNAGVAGSDVSDTTRLILL